MAGLLQDLDKLDEAETLFREVLAAHRETMGENHPSTQTSINNMGVILQQAGKFDEAEPLLREALDLQRQTLGNRHISTLTSANNMGGLLLDLGKTAEAEQMFRESYKGCRSLLGQRDSRTVSAAHRLGALLQARGEHAEAAPLLAMTQEVCALPSCGRGHATGVKLKSCHDCSSVMYCSKEHQLEHWKAVGGHKAVCRRLQAAARRSTATGSTSIQVEGLD